MSEKRMCQHCGENFSPATADRHQTWPSHVVVSECRDNLERQVKALRDALRRYGEHDGDCAASVVGAAGDTKCTCGYDEAVANGSPPLRPREG